MARRLLPGILPCPQFQRTGAPNFAPEAVKIKKADRLAAVENINTGWGAACCTETLGDAYSSTAALPPRSVIRYIHTVAKSKPRHLRQGGPPPPPPPPRPPNSPDLSGADYFRRGVLRKEIHRRRSGLTDSTNLSIRRGVDAMPLRLARRAISPQGSEDARRGGCETFNR